MTPEQLQEDCRQAPRLGIESYYTLSAIDGWFVEFGVASGNTIRNIALLNLTRKVVGFDSFKGLPEPWGGMPVGAFACSVPTDLPRNVTLVVGMFADTLPVWLENNPGPIAFAHIDSDLYSSAKCILDNIAPRCEPGTLLAFDEIVEYPNFELYEAKAFCEFLEATGFSCQCVARLRSPNPDKAMFKLVK